MTYWAGQKVRSGFWCALTEKPELFGQPNIWGHWVQSWLWLLNSTSLSFIMSTPTRMTHCHTYQGAAVILANIPSEGGGTWLQEAGGCERAVLAVRGRNSCCLVTSCLCLASLEDNIWFQLRYRIGSGPVGCLASCTPPACHPAEQGDWAFPKWRLKIGRGSGDGSPADFRM